LFFREGAHNSGLEDIIAKSAQVLNPGPARVGATATYNELVPKSASYRFYNYAGSLTTPGCFETVNWIVAQEVMEVSKEQLDMLRQVKNGKDDDATIAPNLRPIQALNGRVVRVSDPLCCIMGLKVCGENRPSRFQVNKARQACGFGRQTICRTVSKAC
jgi:carbonic anhydrase